MYGIHVNMAGRSKMSPTTTNSQVLAPILGHHQTAIILVQGSETIQKLIIINWEISYITSRYIKNVCQECKVKTVQEIQKLQRHVKNNYFGKKQF
jgi:hypothetical protein